MAQRLVENHVITPPGWRGFLAGLFFIVDSIKNFTFWTESTISIAL